MLLVAVSLTAVLEVILAVTPTVVLATAGVVRLPTVNACRAAEELTTPFVAGYPCTSSPFGVTSCPILLVVKSPARVYSCTPVELFVTKNPFPDKAMFDGVPVALTVPSVKLLSMEATVTPDPTCTGSPLPFEFPACENMSLKVKVPSL